MQLKPAARAWRALFVALLAVTAFVSATAAKADDAGTVPPVQPNNSIGSIRGELLYFQNTHVNGIVGEGLGGGITITVDHHASSDRTSVGVDYINASKDGNSLHMIPMFVEYQSYQGEKSGYHPYITYGAGVIFSNVTDTTNINVTGGKSGTTAGGMFGYGIDMKSSLYLEARYIIAGSIYGEDLSGPVLYLGYRL